MQLFWGTSRYYHAFSGRNNFFFYMPVALHFSLDSSHFVTCQYFIYLASHLVDVVFLIKSYHKVIPKHSPGDSQTSY